MTRPRPSRDRFTLLDLMVLVGATAAALAMLRPYLAAMRPVGMMLYTSPPMQTIEATYGVWSMGAAWLMVALLVLRYRRPHPSRGRLARRPGHVACMVATVALGIGLVEAVWNLIWRIGLDRPTSMYGFWITTSVRVGPAVASAWLLLALSGRLRADPGWIDRLGRVLGACWVGWLLLWLVPPPIRDLIPPLWQGGLS